MNAEKTLADNFCCAKCRNKVAAVRIVWLSGSLLSFMAGTGGTAKYYLVTCGLCGYTEMYDARVYAMQMETSPEQAPLPQKP